MSNEFSFADKLPKIVEGFVESYESHKLTRHIDQAFLPAPAEVTELIERMLELMFPGFFGRQNLTRHNVPFHVGELLPRIGGLAFRQIAKCLAYKDEVDNPDCTLRKAQTELAKEVTEQFISSLVGVRGMLAGDVQAAFDGDPAAMNCDEVILAYPGLLAIAVHRPAHELYKLDVPMLPRMLSEWAHSRTGVDIHPGARIGKNFFIDHGTGVVIGETTDIGRNVKIYQGVTLGALSFPRDERGNIIKGQKRHPTVEDNVTIYANAIILGGNTVLHEGAVIGGSVFLTESVPAGAKVNITPPALRVKKPADR